MSHPNWWTHDVAQAWSRARSGEMSVWYAEGGRQRLLPHGVAERAVGFGWTACRVLPVPSAWGADLQQRLEADWSAAGHGVYSAWWKVAAAVQHGWERAAAQLAAARRGS